MHRLQLDSKLRIFLTLIYIIQTYILDIVNVYITKFNIRELKKLT